MSKKLEKQRLILDYLSQNKSWVEASELALFLNVSRRSINNYVNQINERSVDDRPIIISSQNGYKLNPNHLDSKQPSQNDSASKREILIINRLLKSKDPIDYFDLANDLFISESTLESDIAKARTLLKSFDIELIVKKYKIKLEGTERDKRRLMNNLITKEDYHFFNSLDVMAEIFPEFDIKFLQEIIYRSCSVNGLYLNDYSLQNILIHLIITVDRIKTNNVLINSEYSKLDYSSTDNHIIIRCAYEIISKIQEKYNISFIPSEISYLAVIIGSNASNINFQAITYRDLNKSIDQSFIDVIEKALSKVCNYYYLEPFPDDFKLKFTIHIFNMYKRLQYNCTVLNPLADDIKNSYPFIFDVSLLFSNEFSKVIDLEISQSEIAFIAYHFGAYFENAKKQSNKLRCIFVSNIYYDIEMIQTEKITGYFKDEVDLVQHCTFKQISNPYISSLNLDFIISTSPLNVITKTPVYIVHPIITDRDIDYLKSKIQKLFNQKRKSLIRQHLYKFVDHSLFKKNFYEDDYISMIKDLCYEVQLKGYIDDSFMPDVIKREELYSTAFDNIVAIPHTLSVNAKKSFFSIVLNDKKIAWGDTYVNIIVLVGINDNDLSSFRLIFDWLVNILTDRSHYSLLLKSKDYDDFINNLFCNM